MSRWIALTVVLSVIPLSANAKGSKRFLKVVPNRSAFNTLAERQAESFAQGTAELKFIISKPRDEPVCWFFNSRRYPSHFHFAKDVLGEISQLRNFRQAAYFSDTRRFLAGEIVAHDQWLGPDGTRGVYVLSFWPRQVPATWSCFSEQAASPIWRTGSPKTSSAKILPRSRRPSVHGMGVATSARRRSGIGPSGETDDVPNWRRRA
jgi:hypothetical protein